MNGTETKTKIDDFTKELAKGLRIRFKALSIQLNGSGRPTAQQLTACILADSADIQRYSPEFLEEYQFRELTEPLREHPEFGESIRPFYDAVK